MVMLDFDFTSVDFVVDSCVRFGSDLMCQVDVSFRTLGGAFFKNMVLRLAKCSKIQHNERSKIAPTRHFCPLKFSRQTSMHGYVCRTPICNLRRVNTVPSCPLQFRSARTLPSDASAPSSTLRCSPSSCARRVARTLPVRLICRRRFVSVYVAFFFVGIS